MACDPQELSELARCFECLNEVQMNAIEVYLLALAAGVTPDPTALALAAKDFQALTPQQIEQIKAYLLCQINGG